MRSSSARSGMLDYDVREAGKACGLLCLDQSLAQQSQKDEADINKIVERFMKTGVAPMTERPPLKADFGDNVFDFHSAMNLVVKAKEAFMQQPASVRARFGHDAGAFVDFCSDPSNGKEAVKLGIAELVKKEDSPNADIVSAIRGLGDELKSNSDPGDGEVKGAKRTRGK